MLEEGVPHDNLRAFIPYFSSPSSILFWRPHLSPPSITFLSFRGGGEIGGGEADSIMHLEFWPISGRVCFSTTYGLSNLWNIFFRLVIVVESASWLHVAHTKAKGPCSSHHSLWDGKEEEEETRDGLTPLMYEQSENGEMTTGGGGV